MAGDITTEAGRAAALAACPQVDILVNNAGGPPPGDFRTWGRDEWIKAVDANMLTPIELIKATVDKMAERGFGRIVNITSSSVKAPIDVLGLSNGARSGLTGFVAGLARSRDRRARRHDQRPVARRVRHRSRARRWAPRRPSATARRSRRSPTERQRNIPAQRFGTPEEFGAICAFLCSVHAGYITGPERARRRRRLSGDVLSAGRPLVSGGHAPGQASASPRRSSSTARTARRRARGTPRQTQCRCIGWRSACSSARARSSSSSSVIQTSGRA